MNTKILRLFFAVTALFASSGLRAQVVVNEYSCANLHQFYDYFQETEDWIELYNSSASPVNISGYYLSDNEDNPTKWEFPNNTSVPANGFLYVWCSGRDLKDPQGRLHTNFKLNQTKNNPEHIVLADAGGNVLQDIEVVTTFDHQSRARATNGSNEWRYCLNPTLGASNNGANMAIAYAARPSMNQPAGFYNGSVTVAISSTEPDAVVRYTLDGSEPTASSAAYNAPIEITQTTVVKAATFSNNPLIHRSFTQFNTYFIDEEHTLAVVSIGSDGVIELANGDQSLRPVGCIEYFDKSGDRKARTYGEMNSHGQDSWANDQRSLDWVSRDEMGYNASINEALIPQLTDREEFQRIILRAAGDDNYPAAHHPQNEGSAHVRDAYIQNLTTRGGLYLDVRKSEKCVVYLNGQYWGVYDIREKVDDHDYTDYYYNQGEFDIQYVKTWGWTWAEYGGDQAITDWHAIRSFILNNNMNDPDKFQHVDEVYDYKSLIDYVIVNSFTVCTDWLNYNTGIWRGFNPEGTHQKWGYVLWDNDATFDHYINYTGLPSTHFTAKPCNPEGLTGGSDPEQHIRVLNKLRTNQEVERYYVNRMIDLMYTVFGCENMLSYLDTIEATIDPEMTRHALRWDGTYNEWKNNLDEMRDFITNRCTILPSLMDDCYTVSGPYSMVVKVEPPLSGTVNINTLSYTANQFPLSRPFFGGADAGMNLWAVADEAAGYQFDHWSAGQHTFTNPDSAFAYLAINSADTIVAHFTKETSAIVEPGKSVTPTFAASPTIFSDVVTVNYQLPEKSALNLRVYDLTGNQVAEQLVGETVGKGVARFELSEQLPAGVYFLRCTAGNFEQTIKLVRVQ
ncbi:MAG: CotH kinase family protein [Saprospiraceae bacterium]|nr:CotH kinase family protein [Saprospiraceae bacterium]